MACPVLLTTGEEHGWGPDSKGDGGSVQVNDGHVVTGSEFGPPGVVDAVSVIRSTGLMEQTARSAPMRSGGEFFAAPAERSHRRYEALRAYLFEGLPLAVAAARFGYTRETLGSAVRDF